MRRTFRKKTPRFFLGATYGSAVKEVPGVRVTFTDAGHILGSASAVLDCVDDGKPKRLGFNGDIGLAGLPIIRDPEPPAAVNAVIMEGTYGNRDHPFGTVRAIAPCATANAIPVSNGSPHGNR